MSPVSIREPDAGEAAALAELLNAHSRAIHGEADLSVDEVCHWFTMKNIWMRVVERDGCPVAYLDVADDHEDGTRFHVDARPLDAEAADAAAKAAVEHARAHAAPEAIVRGYAPERDEACSAAYERAGFRVVRHSFEMRIDDLRDVAAPVWPEGICVRTFRPEDEEVVWAVTNEAFADHWDHQPPTPEGRAQWRHRQLESPRFDPELWFLAEDGGEVAGVGLCDWHHSGDPRFGWVQTLGVRRRWRRRGLALALLRHAFAEFARRGATRVGLGVDAENTTGAVRLYECAGMHVERLSDTWELTL
ncbi:MAG: N-acetyltransferase family protein [Gaiellaceae bacterium]